MSMKTDADRQQWEACEHGVPDGNFCEPCNTAMKESRGETPGKAKPLQETKKGGSSMNHKLDTDTACYFYENDFYPLSNFSAFRLLWDNVDFDTAEHAYHYEKFRGKELEIRNVRHMVAFAKSAHEAFKLAEANKDLVRDDWPIIRVEVMRRILRAKANQHEYVRRKLLQTGERELIEDSWRDAWWGWGPEKNGLNMLGKLWMEIRTELRAQPTDSPKGERT